MDDTKKRRLEEIYLAGLKAVDPEEAIRRHVQLTGDYLKVDAHSYPLASFKRIIVTGFGILELASVFAMLYLFNQPHSCVLCPVWHCCPDQCGLAQVDLEQVDLAQVGPA